jgi:hypothetical protein
MKRSISEGYYTFVQESPDRIVLARSRHDRLSSALLLIAAALLLWGVAVYSLLRPVRDMPGFIFFTLVGLGLLLAAVFSMRCWTEIEFDASQHTIIKWRYAFGQVSQLKILSFEQLKTIRQAKVYGEYVSLDLNLIGPSGKVWATLPGYVFHSHGQRVRKRLLAFIKEALEAGNSTHNQGEN